MKMEKQLKLAFVGGAPNSAAGYAHFVASQMDGRWRLEAGAFSRNEKSNRAAAEAYGVQPSRAYENLDALLAKESGAVDAVAILAPTPDHYRMVERALARGVPVICEKSLSLTSTEARQIEAAREKSNGFLAVIYNYSGYPMVRELRRMIRNGELGDILHFQAEMPQEGYVRTDSSGHKPAVQEWRKKDGPVPILHLDLAVHLHELLHYLTGLEPLEVVADQSSNGWFDVIDNVNCLCRYTEGVQGQVWFSKSALGHRNGLRLRIYGSKASAEWFQMNPEELLVSFVDGRRIILDRGAGSAVASQPRYTRFKAGHPAGFIEALANLYVDIAEALERFRSTGRQDSEEVFGAPLAIQGMEWLEAMVRSCHSRQWEKVRPTDDLPK
jgi:predicted dehydrogenase